MARIPAMGTAYKPYRVHQGPGSLELGHVTSEDPTTIGATRTSVGLTEGNIEWSSNTEVAELRSDQLFNPHGMVETSWAHQVTFSADHLDIWNYALALAYNQTAISASSILYLDGHQPQSYRCMRIITEGARDTGATAQATQNIDFWKVKVVSSGGMSMGRETKSSLPMIIHGLCNSSDRVGEVSITPAFADHPSYV